MPNNFETAGDGHHHLRDPGGKDWRKNPFERMASYGNFAGPGNRNDDAHKAGDPGRKPGQADFKPIDKMDAAAEHHDEAYEALHGKSMWGWDGIKQVHKADRTLAEDTDHEMATNSGAYTKDAKNYSKAMRGIFGGRASVVEGTEWAGGKAKEAKQGVSDFAHSTKDWHSPMDAARGMGQGLKNGAQWAGQTASQGYQGVKKSADYFHNLGGYGMAGAAFGGGEALAAGGVHAAGQAAQGAWSGAKKAGQGLASGASAAAHTAGTAISNGASTVAGGARKAGSAVTGAASKALHWLGH